MPKYQIILSSDEQLTDQEFEKAVLDLQGIKFQNGSQFKIISGLNLEGIREELWKRKEELKTEVAHSPYCRNPVEVKVDETFEEINKLFKF